MFEINAMGQACPLPVIQTKKALKEHNQVKTLVDNEIATQNLAKMAEQLGYQSEITTVGPQEYVVVVAKDGASIAEVLSEEKVAVNSGYVVVIDTDVMGRGDETLGRNLLKGFVYSLTEQDQLPEKVIMYNGGVKLTVEGSDSLEDLQQLAEAGVEIYACGACVDFFDLKEKVRTAEITNMYRIVEMMRQAGKVVKP